MTTDKEAVRVDAWQPIKTAPKDGTRIVLYAAQWTDDGVTLGEWSERIGCWSADAGCMEDGPAMTSDVLDGPTHWMPVPAPPAQGGEGERT